VDGAFLELLTIVAAFVGLTGALLGVSGLMLRRRGLVWHAAAVAFSLLLAACGVGAVAAGLPAPVWAAPAVLAAAILTAQALQLPRVSRFAADLLAAVRRPWVPATALLVACPILAVWSAANLQAEPNPFSIFQDFLPHCRPVELEEVVVETDAGRRVSVYALRDENGADLGPAPDDASILRDRAARLIRTAPPELSHDCHGWVFTAGRYWVRGRDVDAILQDNGYRKVSVPQPGDVVVYRDVSGAVLHTALVRVAAADNILVEGKWGPLGRYIHPVADQVYGDRFEYYHTDRPRHTLRGVEESSPTDTSRPNPALNGD
jgi:hypothetical protein